jgi:type II secretory pathway pseudopilin PulG
MSISNHPVEQEELMAYLDGELSPKSAVETASHLEHCRECQKLAADLREISQMMTTWQVEASDDGLADAVAQELEKQEQGRPERAGIDRGAYRMLWKRGLFWTGGAAAAVAILFAIFVPSLLRSSKGAEESARIARLRQVQAQGRLESVPSEQGRNDTSIYSYASENRLKHPMATPGATPRPGVGSLGRLQADLDIDGQNESDNPTSAVNGPMIVRTAELEVTTKDFDKARPSVEEILKRRHGYIGELNVNTPTGAARSLTGTLRVPATQLDTTLADLKALGRTEKESQGGEEVTQQYVDLQARLANSKHTEQRLTDILRERTGKLSDVLAVEMQISRVRGEIEQMEAQRKTMKNQVDFATLTLTVSEEYKEQLKAVPSSTGTQFRNAAVEGYRSLVDGIISILLWLLSAGPTLLVWAAILFFPVRMLWRKIRDRRNRT